MGHGAELAVSGIEAVLIIGGFAVIITIGLKGVLALARIK